VIWSYDAAMPTTTGVYGGAAIVSPWANTDKLPVLLQFLAHGVRDKPSDAFFVSQVPASFSPISVEPTPFSDQ